MGEGKYFVSSYNFYGSFDTNEKERLVKLFEGNVVEDTPSMFVFKDEWLFDDKHKAIAFTEKRNRLRGSGESRLNVYTLHKKVKMCYQICYDLKDRLMEEHKVVVPVDQPLRVPMIKNGSLWIRDEDPLRLREDFENEKLAYEIAYG